MLENKVYSFSELRTILKEEKNEFDPKYGKGYNAKTEGNQNEKAVKDITKQVKDMDGGLQDKVQRKANSKVLMTRTKLLSIMIMRMSRAMITRNVLRRKYTVIRQSLPRITQARKISRRSGISKETRNSTMIEAR